MLYCPDKFNPDGFALLVARASDGKVPIVSSSAFKDDEYIGSVITFALLERKEKIATFSEGQKKLFNDITEYCFKKMENMSKDDIGSILKAYVENRQRDDKANRDTNRRYYISSLPENDFPKILKVVERMCSANEDIKKYF